MLQFAIDFLTGKFPYSFEFQAFFMALQGVMKVRTGPNRDGKMSWFHAFGKGVILSYAGGIFAPLWIGRPTSMLSNDINMGACIITYSLVNCIPFKIGYRIANTFPIKLMTVMGAQLFRTMGIITFITIAYEAFKNNPSKYYPTPIFGPILFATILGNMGSFFALGFNGHLKRGMPLPFQNGLFVSSLYHFTVNDTDGPIGIALRSLLDPFMMGFSHKQFATLFISSFMQLWAVLQMPEFLGSSFNPFDVVSSIGNVGSKQRTMTNFSTPKNNKNSNTTKKQKKKKTN